MKKARSIHNHNLTRDARVIRPLDFTETGVGYSPTRVSCLRDFPTTAARRWSSPGHRFHLQAGVKGTTFSPNSTERKGVAGERVTGKKGVAGDENGDAGKIREMEREVAEISLLMSESK